MQGLNVLTCERRVVCDKNCLIQFCSVAELVVEVSKLGEAGLPGHVQLQEAVGLVQTPGNGVRRAE